MCARIVSAFASAALLLIAACAESHTEAPSLSPLAATPPSHAVSAPSFAYAAPDGTIWMMNADGAGRQQLLAEPLATGNSVAFSASGLATWSTDGQKVVYIASSALGLVGPATGDLWVLDVSSGQRSKIDGNACCLRHLRGRLFYDRRVDSSPLSYSSEPVMLEFTGGGTHTRAIAHGASLSPDGTQIAWVDTSRPSEGTSVTVRGYPLFVSDVDGGNASHLRENSTFADWSPDGKYLMYWKNERGGTAAHGDVCVIDLATDGEVCLREFSSDEGPQWAPNPRRYIFHNYLIDPLTGSATELFERPYAVVAWSDDGEKVAYTVSEYTAGQPTTYDLVIRDLVSEERTILHTQNVGAHHSERGGYYGVWSPDSRYFAFVAIEATDSNAGLYVFDTTTRGLNASLQHFPYRSVSISYSPDSSWLLIARDQWENPTTWIARADGSGAVKLVDGLPISGSGWRPVAD